MGTVGFGYGDIGSRERALVDEGQRGAADRA